MFSRNRDYTTRAEPSGGIIPTIHCVLASAPHPGVGVRTFSKEPPTHQRWAGVVNLALTFGTLLSSQGTDASFVLTRETLSGFPPGSFPSVLRFRLYQTLSCPISSVPFRFPLRPFGFPRFPFRRSKHYQSFSAAPTVSSCGHAEVDQS